MGTVTTDVPAAFTSTADELVIDGLRGARHWGAWLENVVAFERTISVLSLGGKPSSAFTAEESDARSAAWAEQARIEELYAIVQWIVDHVAAAAASGAADSPGPPTSWADLLHQVGAINPHHDEIVLADRVD